MPLNGLFLNELFFNGLFFNGLLAKGVDEQITVEEEQEFETEKLDVLFRLGFIPSTLVCGK